MRYQAYAKVNIFLKIIGTRGTYHELLSRFMRVESLFDTLWFAPKKTTKSFELVGNFNCNIQDNTLFKAYHALCKAGFEQEVKKVMGAYALHVQKAIPTGAGLGGGSSDSATFLMMLNEKANLHLSSQELMDIGSRVGADVAFFASQTKSANVSGIGEIVEIFDEEILPIEVATPPMACDTAQVYQAYRKHFLKTIEAPLAQQMLKMSSKTLLSSFSRETLNDLYAPALKCYPLLQSYAKEGWFFSGSGSSFFRIKETV